MVEFDEVKLLIGEILQLGERIQSCEPDTPLLGSIPEFDSMAVVTLIHALQQQFAIQIADDEISAENFATFGAVYEFARAQAHKARSQRRRTKGVGIAQPAGRRRSKL